MITDYYRPETLSEALELLKDPDTLPLGGGTFLSTLKSAPTRVVDLQALGLNKINNKGKELEIGATASLDELLKNQHTPPALKKALKLEAPLNIRNTATVAGTLTMADGRSTFTTALLALDAKLSIVNQKTEIVNLGDFLPLRPNNSQGELITAITIPLNAELAIETAARTPADKPIVCVALAKWQSGRMRLVLGGFGCAPLLAMDGTGSEGLKEAARNAFREAADEWASAEYRMDVSAILAKRCLE